jgi:hypothetical protein
VARTDRHNLGGRIQMGFILGGILYFVLLVTLGLLSIRKGHWVMFILGEPVPGSHRGGMSSGTVVAVRSS